MASALTSESSIAFTYAVFVRQSLDGDSGSTWRADRSYLSGRRLQAGDEIVLDGRRLHVSELAAPDTGYVGSLFCVPATRRLPLALGRSR